MLVGVVGTELVLRARARNEAVEYAMDELARVTPKLLLPIADDWTGEDIETGWLSPWQGELEAVRGHLQTVLRKASRRQRDEHAAAVEAHAQIEMMVWLWHAYKIRPTRWQVTDLLTGMPGAKQQSKNNEDVRERVGELIEGLLRKPDPPPGPEGEDGAGESGSDEMLSTPQ